MHEAGRPHDVARDDRVLGVDELALQTVGLGGSSVGVVDLLDGDVAVEDRHEVGDRAVRHRHAHRDAVHLPLQLRERERRRLRGAGRRGDDVDRRGASAPQILVRQVEQVLVVRVGVHGGHQRAIDPEGVLEHLGERHDAVRRARRVGDHVVRRRVVGVVVHAHHDRDVLALGRRADDHLLGAGLEMGRRLLPIREQAGRLDHDLGADLLPRELRGISLREHTQLVAVDGDPVLRDRHLAVEATQDRVVLQQMREGLRVRDVVDADEVDVRARLPGGAQEVAADPSETVDTDLHAHRGEPPRARWRLGLSILRAGLAACPSMRACGRLGRSRRPSQRTESQSRSMSRWTTETRWPCSRK